MTVPSLLARVVRILDETEIAFMLTGSLAAALYGPPRATQDLDLVVDLTARDIDGIVDRLRAEGFYVSRAAAHEALEARGQFNAIEPDEGWKIDFMVRRDRPFSVMEFERRQPANLLGVEIYVATAEDLIVAKLEWIKRGDSDLQRRDVVQLLEARWHTLDREHVERWVERLGLETEWEDALGRVRPPPD